MLVLAWVLALAGAVVAYVVSLAGAMRTVPRLSWREALVGVPLPMVAGLIAIVCLVRVQRPSVPMGTLSASLALGVAALTLAFMALTYFGQPGGPM
jgi:hypothetical protein